MASKSRWLDGRRWRAAGKDGLAHMLVLVPGVWLINWVSGPELAGDVLKGFIYMIWGVLYARYFGPISRDQMKIWREDLEGFLEESDKNTKLPG